MCTYRVSTLPPSSAHAGVPWQARSQSCRNGFVLFSEVCAVSCQPHCTTACKCLKTPTHGSLPNVLQSSIGTKNPHDVNGTPEMGAPQSVATQPTLSNFSMFSVVLLRVFSVALLRTSMLNLALTKKLPAQKITRIDLRSSNASYQMPLLFTFCQHAGCI